ncbi:hypothetical protein [Natranaeroarchaeum aerophilus]|uniref:Uncharacterized protein n=1 Tax=Natranaeroarchaeum aerophilus TaxID=2917711 RepID=A0AAE3FSB8_9EURY|nr:hypothetical protein [Natranaeroarchaeum aerophilus]MCL9814419.1 hypothetical protein [Natranaeroarchaeum aerophilus]
MVQRIGDDTLKIGNSKVKFKHPIKKYLKTKETIIVLLDVPVNEHNNRNVLGINHSGHQLWEIEPVIDPSERSSHYTNIVEREGEIWALNWRGDEYCLAPETGEVLKKQFRRF